jgi:hypothetical protein
VTPKLAIQVALVALVAPLSYCYYIHADRTAGSGLRLYIHAQRVSGATSATNATGGYTP